MELYSEAEQSYQAYLAISSNPKGISIAARGKAWSLWFQERYAESAVAFETAARAALTLDEQLETRLKAGDSYWMEKKYEQALSAYNAAAVADPKNKLAPQAAFQAALCLNLLNREDVALPHFKQIIKRYPFDEFADKSRLEIGRIYVRQGEWEKAMETYKFIDRSDAKDQLKADALTRMAIIYYKTADYEEAYKLFNTIRAKFPESKEAVQAFFMRGFCLLHLGKPDEALKICHEFLEKYPESEWITEVMFWAGKYYYNEAKYKDAELSFASIADLYPNHEITPHALYWAGRSATAQDQFTKALEYYSTLAKDHPNSPRLAEARFAQGEVLSELGEFSRAILAFDEVIKNYPTSIWSDLARGRKGDCNFALGADNPIRYKEAKAAYQMLLQSATAPADAKLQAMYKIGRCDEKMDKITDALSKYMEVIYAYLNGEFDKSQSNTLWFTRAAFSAGAIKEEAEDWREAVNIYNRIIEANVPAADEARKRVESIQQKHFYLF